MTLNKKTLLTRFLPVVFYVLLAVFLVFYLKNIDYDQLRHIQFSWGYLILGSLFALAFRFWGTFIWFTLLRGLGATQLTEVRKLIYVYAKAWMGRYIPGTAPWILGKIYFASQYGISKNKLAVSSFLEGGLQVVVLLAISFGLLIFDSRLDVIDPRLKLLMLVILVGLIGVMLPPIFNRIIALGYKLLRKKTMAKEDMVGGNLISKGALLYAFGSILSGLSFFFFAKSIYPGLEYSQVLFVMGAFNLAGAISILAIITPSGLGVREGIQLVLLSLIMPKEVALVITIAARLWSTVIDFLFFGLSRAIGSTKSKKSDELIK